MSSVGRPAVLSRFPGARLAAAALVVVLLALAGALALRRPWAAPPAAGVRASGRIEADEVELGARIAGRIARTTVEEGARVARGQVVAVLEDDGRRDAAEAASERVRAAEAAAAAARAAEGVLAARLRATQLAGTQSGVASAGTVGAAEAALAVGEAQLAQARAQRDDAHATLRLAERDRGRIAPLVASGDLARREGDAAATRVANAAAALAARDAAVAAAARALGTQRAQLTGAGASRYEPPIRAREADAVRAQLAQAASQAAAAAAEAGAARAQAAQARVGVDELVVRSPIDGLVSVAPLRPGAVVAAGRPVVVLIDPRSLYVRAFVPDAEIGRVRVGDPARVFLDAAPERALRGHVASVDAQASFTPENVYFRDDRVRQVFGVRVTIDDSQGLAKPGLPADVEIAVR